MGKMTWWKCADLIEFFKALGFSDEAINDAALVRKRIEFHHDDKLLYVKGPMGANAADGGGFNFSHTCPPDCPG